MSQRPCAITVLGLLLCLLGRAAWGQGEFYRGDCNSSQEADGAAVDVSDAAAIISFLFGVKREQVVFKPSCLDACDANDDGAIDMSDPMFVIHFVFLLGPFPPAPGPGLVVRDGEVKLTPPGTDPTEDTLDCDLQPL